MILLLIPLGLAVCMALWTVISSAAALAMIGQLSQFQPPYWQWWELRPYWSTGPWPMLVVWVSAAMGLVPFAIMYYSGLATWRTSWNTRMQPSLWWTWQLGRLKRGITDNYGHTRWMTVREMRRRFRGRHGIVVGEACRVDQSSVSNIAFDPRSRRTWGKGGKCKLLIDDPSRGSRGHSIVFSGTGKYKTTSAVSTILMWRGSCVVLDPSCELAPMLSDALRKQGQQVFTLSPETGESTTINALDWIDPEDPMAEEHVHTVISWIWHEDERVKSADENMFVGRARDLTTCLLASMIWDGPAGVPKTLEALRFALSSSEPEMRQILADINQGSRSLLARRLASELFGVVHETFSGILTNVSHGTSWLSTRAYADLVSGGGLRTEYLRRGNITVFIQVGLQALMNRPEVARTVIGAFMHSIIRADGRIAGNVLFLLDEAAQLGHMRLVDAAGVIGRKYGIVMHMLYQSVGQFRKQWGPEGKQNWYENLSWRGYAAIQDIETAKEVSELFGYNSVMSFSESDNLGSGNVSKALWHNTNRSEIKRALVLPQELLQEARDDEMFVYAGGLPIRCGRAIYFRRHKMASVVNISNYAKRR